MLSVCVPVYRYFVLGSVSAGGGLPQVGPSHIGQRVYGQLDRLYRQLRAAGIPFELLVYEDASPAPYPAHNRQVAELGPEVRYRLLDHNLGRAAIRNRLARDTRYERLLLIDADSGFPEGYIARYLPYLKGPAVVAGGRRYPEKASLPAQYHLHHRYGQSREQLDLQARGDALYRGFQTNNFLVDRALLIRHPFEEDHQGYGHEDTLWGWQLRKMGVELIRIDNPVVHLQLEAAPTFLDKQLEAVDNLKRLQAKDPSLPSRLSDLAQHIAFTQPLWSLLPGLLRATARRQLLKQPPGSLYWLDLLKLDRYMQ